MKLNVRKIAIAACWVLIWQLVYLLVNNDIVFAGPADTVQALFEIVRSSRFWTSLLHSLLKILTGFFCGCLCGFIFASFSYKNSLIREFLQPAVALCKSVPVASFVILAIIIAGSAYLSILISFIIVFPQVYTAVLAGYENTDKKLLEAAEIYQMPFFYRFWALYLPSLSPFLLSSSRLSLGMAWKSGIAAEVIGVAKNSIGEQLYMSKIYLLTENLFAYTITIILLSASTEKILDLLLKHALASKRIFHKNLHKKKAPITKGLKIQLLDIDKSFGTRSVLNGVSLDIEPSGTICIMGESGSGKTTLLNIIAGLTDSDNGEVLADAQKSPGVVFQDDRLFEELNAVQNIRLISSRSETEIKAHLLKLLDQVSLDIPVSRLSGGMRRRACICRAILSNSNILILDEPFSGLDNHNRERAAAYISGNRGTRPIVFTSHQQEDAHRLSACVYTLTKTGLKA